MELLNVVKNDASSDAIIYLFPQQDFLNNSQLIVNESEEALFVKNGMVVQIFKGGRYTLSTNNYPFLTTLKSKLIYGGQNPFNCKIYFINKSHKLELYWGTDSPMQVRDAEFGFMVSVRARGSYSIQVDNSKKFLLKLVGNNKSYWTKDDVEESFRTAFVTNIKALLSSHMQQLKHTILDIAPELVNLSQIAKVQLSEILSEYGLSLINFYISDVSIPENDPNYEKINNAYAEKGTMTIQGANWDKITSKEIMKDMAKSGGGSAGASLGLGLGAMGMFAGMGANTLQGINTTTQPFPEKTDGVSFCPDCGQKVSTGTKFCSGCGKKLSDKKVCPKCGTELKQDDRFCSICGEKV